MFRLLNIKLDSVVVVLKSRIRSRFIINFEVEFVLVITGCGSGPSLNQSKTAAENRDSPFLFE